MKGPTRQERPLELQDGFYAFIYLPVDKEEQSPNASVRYSWRGELSSEGKEKCEGEIVIINFWGDSSLKSRPVY